MSYSKSTEIIIEQPPSYNINNYKISDDDINKQLESISIAENKLIEIYELIGSQYATLPLISNIKNKSPMIALSNHYNKDSTHYSHYINTIHQLHSAIRTARPSSKSCTMWPVWNSKV